jgi:hypothetical protein
MTGKNDIIKKINSYLAHNIISSQLVPDDECEKEAEHIFHMEYKNPDKIASYLNRHFGFEASMLNFKDESEAILKIIGGGFVFSCIICNKEIRLLYPEAGDMSNLREASYLEISAGYGSDFDTTTFKAVICDDCIGKSLVSNKFHKIMDNASEMSHVEIKDFTDGYRIKNKYRLSLEE